MQGGECRRCAPPVIFITMKKLLTLIIVSTSVCGATAASGLSIDFNNGIPPEVRLYDLDGLTPASDLDFTGLKAGIPWTPCDVEKTGSRVAVSTSWYKPAGKADDWMVIPAVEVSSDTELRWTARAFDPQLSDGYSVYVSLTGDTPQDFDRSKPLFRVDAESAQWTDHNLSLAGYAGQSVSIAFVNESQDCNMLLLRSVTIGTPEKLILSFAGETAIAMPGTEIPLRFKASTDLTTAQTLLRAGCTLNDKVYSITDLGRLEPREEVEFEIPARVSVEKDVMTPVTVWVESDLGKTEKTVWLGNCDRKMVIEEATGTWCGYCVSGIAVLNRVKKEYPGQAICIAVHNGDPMAIDGYSVKGSGNPRLTLNREGGEMHPLDLEEALTGRIDELPRVAVDGEWYLSDSQVNVRANILSGGKSESSYRMAFVLVENDVHVPDNPRYSQKNYYADGQEGPMDGFEDLPNPIPAKDMWFQDVARGIYPSQQGVPCSPGSQLPIGEKTEVSYSFPLPENVLDRNNLELFVLAIDAATSNVMNGCKAVGRGESDVTKTEAVFDAEVISVEWYDISGRRVLKPDTGLYIRMARLSDGSTRSRKVILSQ